MATQPESVSTEPLPYAERRHASRRWSRLLHDPHFWVGGSMLASLFLFSFVGPVFDRAVGEQYNMAIQFQPPSLRHLLGTNVLGQDEVAQLMVGGQLPIITGFVAAFGAALIGYLVGLVAGYSGNLVDSVLMRFTDLFLSVPQVVPILLVEALLGANTRSLIIVVVLTSWPTTARILRARILVLRRQPFVEAALSGGASHARVLLQHVLPNAADDIIVAFVNQFANVVLIMAIASFIGLGLPPPWNWASMFWGNMDSITQWWLVFPPGIAFSALLVSVYFIGEALRHALNPHGREAR